ncbi:MAG: tyrosine-type recombinase/integrase [Akkermansiaceae bacterium]
MLWKIEAAGELTPNLKNVKRHLEVMAKKFAGMTVIDITSDQLTVWWRKEWGDCKPKTRNDARASFVAFWNWCILETIYPKEVTPAERIPLLALAEHERRVITPDEFMALAAEIQPQYRSTIVLLAFCAFRPEEVCPPTKKGAKKKNKRGIRREEIDWEDNCIRIPSAVAKTGNPRVVPLLPTARVWLEWAGLHPGQRGPVCEENLAEVGETKRLGEVVFKTGWPKDALRHSYGSYRNAIVRSLDQVAEEMGSSEAMLRKHYHNPRSRSEGEAWFDLRPPQEDGLTPATAVLSAEEYLKMISENP